MQHKLRYCTNWREPPTPTRPVFWTFVEHFSFSMYNSGRLDQTVGQKLAKTKETVGTIVTDVHLFFLNIYVLNF